MKLVLKSKSIRVQETKKIAEADITMPIINWFWNQRALKYTINELIIEPSNESFLLEFKEEYLTNVKKVIKKSKEMSWGTWQNFKIA